MIAAPVVTDLDALLMAAIVAPDDYAPRGILADYLEERGDHRYDAARRAPDAARALVGFPEWVCAGRLAKCLLWEQAMPLVLHSPRSPRIWSTEASLDSWPVLVARFFTPYGYPARLSRIAAGSDGRRHECRICNRGKPFYSFESPYRNSYAQHLLDITVAGAIDIVASGDGVLQVSLEASSTELY